MDCGASSSVAEKVSLAPVYSVFMEAPDAQSIKSPPTVGHLLPWLHLHPGASRRIRRSLLLMFTCAKVEDLWIKWCVVVVSWSSVPESGLNHLSAIIRWRWSESCMRAESRRMEENGARICWQRPPAVPCTPPHARSRRSIIWVRLLSAGLLLNCNRVSICSWPPETTSTTSHMCAHSVWAKVVTHLFWQSVDRETLVVVGKIHKRDCEFQSRNENTCKH